MNRYMIIGSYFELMACLDIEEESEEKAIKKWYEVFGDKVKNWYPAGQQKNPTIINIDEKKEFEKFYKGNGWCRYFGDYCY